MPKSLVLATKEGRQNMTGVAGTFSIIGTNKGLWCPFKPIFCQEGFCNRCQIYLDWEKREEIVLMCVWCGTEIGKKPTLAESGISYGICDECEQKYFPE